MVDVSGVVFRAENPGEAAVIHGVVARSFDEPVVADLVDAFRASRDWLPDLSFVAEYDGAVVGHLLFTRSLLDSPQRLVDVLSSARSGCFRSIRAAGVGSALIRHGLSAAAERTEPLVFLEGSPRYYPRFGFEPAGEQGFRSPSLRIPERAF